MLSLPLVLSTRAGIESIDQAAVVKNTRIFGSGVLVFYARSTYRRGYELRSMTKLKSSIYQAEYHEPS